MQLLDKINSPSDLKKLNLNQLPQICDEIRQFLIQSISQSGGHLASNLGTLELTVALHYVFDSPKDIFCWDVGHQTYVHKILTGRKKDLKTLRQWQGLSGFPKITESSHDHYNTGHAGTAISQAFGEAYARDIKLNITHNSTKTVKKRESFPKKYYDVIAIVGDASIACGMTLEAMNHAGHVRTPFLAILNDNEMSISPNVGALNYSLNQLRSLKNYTRLKKITTKILFSIPIIGHLIKNLISAFKSGIVAGLGGQQIFRDLGFKYVGPTDGHNIKQLVKLFQSRRHCKEPTLIHVITKKGKGFNPAEKDPVAYHGVSAFEIKDGSFKKTSNTDWLLSRFVGYTLSKLAHKDKSIIAITPAMKEGSGLVEFSQNFPKQFLDAGIAEQHATTLAGSLAKAGLKAYLCIYSTFLQRGYDQLIHDICLMSLPVKIIIDRAGCVGGDGDTHQGLYDFAFMSCLPNLVILSANSAVELIAMLEFSSNYNEKAIAIRFARDSFSNAILNGSKDNQVLFNKKKEEIKNEVFKSVTVYKGSDVLVLAEGKMVNNSIDAAHILKEKHNISSNVVNLRVLHPLDKKSLKSYFKNFKYIVVIENHAKTNGIGAAIIQNFYTDLATKKFLTLSFPDEPVDHGSIPIIEDFYGLSPRKIANSIKHFLKKK